MKIHPNEPNESEPSIDALAGRPTFVDEGEALRVLGGASPDVIRERFDVVVIGAGQAGLSLGYFLARQGVRFVILDASERVGDVWRKRWDSLRLFTPARLDGLAGMPFPAPRDSFPTKDEMADYLEAYAARFALPVRTRTRVERVTKRDGKYVVHAGAHELTADHVVVAMASYQRPRLPAFASELRRDIVQLHSSAYRAPSQLGAGPVLVVGAGNSGAEIAFELAKAGRVTSLAGPSTGAVPFRVDGLAARLFLTTFLLRFVFHRLLTIKTPFGRKVRDGHRAAPLIRVKPRELANAGIERTPRVTGVQGGLPVLEDGRVLDVRAVVWCTGFEPGLSWIDLPAFDEAGHPRHEGGVVPGEPGFYFLGLHFLYAMSSTMIHGVERDAARIAKTIAARVRAR